MSRKILITNLSILTQYSKMNKYSSENTEIIEGVMTNEAPTKMVLSQNGKLDNIIALTSDDVNNSMKSNSALIGWVENRDNISEEKISKWKHFCDDSECVATRETITHYDYYRNTIEDYCIANGYKSPVFSKIRMPNEPNYNEALEAAMTVKEVISKIAEERNEEVEIYIEANGGIRYVLTMLLSVINTIEKNDNSINLMAVYNMVYNNEMSRIVNQKKVYDSIEILSAVDEFIYYGKTKSLKRLLYSVVEGNVIENHRVEELMSKLEKTADDLQLCRTDSVINDFFGSVNNHGVIEMLENYLSEEVSQNDPVDILFRHVASIIDNEYGKLKECRNKNDGQKLIGVIKWCISKEYIQQAVTFCSERIPKALHEIGIFEISRKFLDSIKNVRGSNNHYELYYDIIANFTGKNPYGQKIIEAAFYQKIRNILQSNVNIYTNSIEYLQQLEKNLEFEPGNIAFENEKYISSELVKIRNCFVNKQISTAIQDTKILKYGGKFSYSNKEKLYINEMIVHENLSNENNAKNVERKMEAVLDNCSRIYFDSVSKLCAEDFSSLTDQLFYDEQHRGIFKNWITDSIIKHDHSVYVDGVNFISHRNNFNRILCVYRIIKEQRNMLNHANVSPDDEAVCLNSAQLVKVIEYLLAEIAME